MRRLRPFEWALVTAIAGLLIALFLNRILALMVDVERVSLLHWEGRLKSALTHELSRRVVAREYENIEQMDGINPMGLLDELPDNYLGEKRRLDLTRLTEGVWVFDLDRLVLVYTIRNSDRFQSGLQGRPRAEYKVELEYRDINRNDHFDFQQDHLKSLKLVSVGDYQWL